MLIGIYVITFFFSCVLTNKPDPQSVIYTATNAYSTGRNEVKIFNILGVLFAPFCLHNLVMEGHLCPHYGMNKLSC